MYILKLYIDIYSYRVFGGGDFSPLKKLGLSALMSINKYKNNFVKTL